MIDPREIEIEKHVVEELDRSASHLGIDSHELASMALEAFTAALAAQHWRLTLPLKIEVKPAR